MGKRNLCHLSIIIKNNMVISYRRKWHQIQKYLLIKYFKMRPIELYCKLKRSGVRVMIGRLRSRNSDIYFFTIQNLYNLNAQLNIRRGKYKQSYWTLFARNYHWIRYLRSCQKSHPSTNGGKSCSEDHFERKDQRSRGCLESFEIDTHIEDSLPSKYHSTLWSKSISNQIIETKRYLFLVIEHL